MRHKDALVTENDLLRVWVAWHVNIDGPIAGDEESITAGHDAAEASPRHNAAPHPFRERHRLNLYAGQGQTGLAPAFWAVSFLRAHGEDTRLNECPRAPSPACLEALAALAELVSPARIGVSNPVELARPAASVPLVKKSLRFIFPSLQLILSKSSRNRFHLFCIVEKAMHTRGKPATQFRNSVPVPRMTVTILTHPGPVQWQSKAASVFAVRQGQDSRGLTAFHFRDLPALCSSPRPNFRLSI